MLRSRLLLVTYFIYRSVLSVHPKLLIYPSPPSPLVTIVCFCSLWVCFWFCKSVRLYHVRFHMSVMLDCLWLPSLRVITVSRPFFPLCVVFADIISEEPRAAVFFVALLLMWVCLTLPCDLRLCIFGRNTLGVTQSLSGPCVDLSPYNFLSYLFALDLHLGMWELAPWPGIEPGSPVLEAESQPLGSPLFNLGRL